jgi:hypothetical protein
MKKVIYFTAGAVATAEELEEITAIRAYTGPLLDLTVSNGAILPNLSGDPENEDDPRIQESDFVAGTIPEAYSGVDELDPDNIGPALDVGSDKAVVTDGQVITIEAATYTFTIVDGAITDITVGGV